MKAVLRYLEKVDPAAAEGHESDTPALIISVVTLRTMALWRT